MEPPGLQVVGIGDAAAQRGSWWCRCPTKPGFVSASNACSSPGSPGTRVEVTERSAALHLRHRLGELTGLQGADGTRSGRRTPPGGVREREPRPSPTFARVDSHPRRRSRDELATWRCFFTVYRCRAGPSSLTRRALSLEDHVAHGEPVVRLSPEVPVFRLLSSRSGRLEVELVLDLDDLVLPVPLLTSLSRIFRKSWTTFLPWASGCVTQR